MLWTILLTLGAVAAITNTVVLFFLVVFLVRQRDTLLAFFSDLVSLLSFDGMLPPPVVNSGKERKKTWDEKYEEELEMMERRRRQDTGLTDLPYPGEPKPND